MTNEDTDQESSPADEPVRRILTLRAILVGLGLTVLMGWVIPWNDWTLGNTLLYNNFMPPAVSIVLLVFGLAINPLLGRFRLHRGEMVVITVMLLGLGGVVSSGLNRYLPTVIGTSSNVLATSASLEPLQVRLTEEERAELQKTFEAGIAQDLAIRDKNGDQVLSADEFLGGAGAFAKADTDNSGGVDHAELVVFELERDPNLVPEWRWPVDPSLYVGMPENGPVRNDDPEFQHVVQSYNSGFGEEANLRRVAHRRQVTWTELPAKTDFEGEALGGRIATEQRRAGENFLDLDDPDTGAHMVGLRAGEAAARPADRNYTVADGDSWGSIAQVQYGDAAHGDLLARYNMANAEIAPSAGAVIDVPDLLVVTNVEPPPVPWYAWWGHLWAWAPLLFGAFVAMIAIAGLVRKQWMDNERLPYPIAAVTLSFMEDPEKGKRFASLFRDKGFWIALVVAGGIITWNGLASYGLVPIGIKTTLSLTGEGKPFSGHPWNMVLSGWTVFNWKIFFSIVALTFFLSLELSFSIWFFFLLANFGTMFLRLGGVPVEGQYIGQASAGGFFTMCALIVWVGRQYYWKVIQASFGLSKDADARNAVPFFWALIAGSLLMVVFFVGRGTPVGAAVLAVVMMLGFLLVLARIVAEAGVPFLQLPMATWFNANLFIALGFSIPVGAMMPLTLIGITLMADPREALLPYAVNAGYLGGKVKAPQRRLSGLMLTAVCVGCVVAFGSMVYFAYTSGGAGNDGWAARLLARDGFEMVSNGLQDNATPKGVAQAAGERTSSLWAYGIGAAIVAALGTARFLFAAWPLHPLGFVTMVTYPTGQIWFSIMVGWMLKLLVMRYGGSGLYAKLKPAAIGLIAGEALAATGFMLAKIIGEVFFDVSLDPFQALPG